MKKLLFALALSLPVLFLYAASPAVYEIKSPNGAIVVRVTVDAHISWSVEQRGQPVILPSSLALELDNGEVLGDKQSGEIQEIGFQLYTDMLNDAVRALNTGSEASRAMAVVMPNSGRMTLRAVKKASTRPRTSPPAARTSWITAVSDAVCSA